MHQLYPPAMQQMLRAVRARRGIDGLDIFNAVVRHQWGELTARQRLQFSRALTVATRMQRQLRGAANPQA